MWNHAQGLPGLGHSFMIKYGRDQCLIPVPVIYWYLCTNVDATGVWVPDSSVCVCDAGGVSFSALSTHSSPEVKGGLYTATAFPSGLRADSVGLRVCRTDIFLLCNPQQFSAHFPLLVRAFLVGPLSPTDFSVGRPMDSEQTSSHNP
jgi:hypothetical protein